VHPSPLFLEYQVTLPLERREKRTSTAIPSASRPFFPFFLLVEDGTTPSYPWRTLLKREVKMVVEPLFPRPAKRANFPFFSLSRARRNSTDDSRKDG